MSCESILPVSLGRSQREMRLCELSASFVAKFPEAIIRIAEVKKTEQPDRYAAKAEITIHGVTNTMDIQLFVVEKAEESVMNRARVALNRTTFGVGLPLAETDAKAMLRRHWSRWN